MKILRAYLKYKPELNEDMPLIWAIQLPIYECDMKKGDYVDMDATVHLSEKIIITKIKDVIHLPNGKVSGFYWLNENIVVGVTNSNIYKPLLEYLKGVL